MAAPAFFVVVDGTGDSDDRVYEAEMRTSFCSQIVFKMQPRAVYQRGPSMLGRETEDYAEWAVKQALAARLKYPGTRLMMAGYSRGGSAVIMAAERLAKEHPPVTIDAMFLFDPVARHTAKGGEVIPANVERVWSARRFLDPVMVDKYDHTIGTGPKIPFVGRWRVVGHNPMRVFFGKTGRQHLGKPGNFIVRDFPGSHGALGGTGWKHVSEDKECQVNVARWMNGAFAKEGLELTIKSYGNNSVPAA